ncbi:MAG TPA: universal stress protein [Candidatus Acidoferrales bacterium]|nr:universal stress protein [Candidatus Acidoferrales bacterium]
MAASPRKPILVAVDGSPAAANGLSKAVDLARALGTEVVAVYVIPTPEFGYAMTTPVEMDPEWRAEIKREFSEDWTRPLRESGLRFQALVEDGRPATVLAEVAERIDAEMIVVGRRGRGGIAELLLGSVSHELALHCRHPLLLISPPRGA